MAKVVKLTRKEAIRYLDIEEKHFDNYHKSSGEIICETARTVASATTGPQLYLHSSHFRLELVQVRSQLQLQVHLQL